MPGLHSASVPCARLENLYHGTRENQKGGKASSGCGPVTRITIFIFFYYSWGERKLLSCFFALSLFCIVSIFSLFIFFLKIALCICSALAIMGFLCGAFSKRQKPFLCP